MYENIRLSWHTYLFKPLFYTVCQLFLYQSDWCLLWLHVCNMAKWLNVNNKHDFNLESESCLMQLRPCDWWILNIVWASFLLSRYCDIKCILLQMVSLIYEISSCYHTSNFKNIIYNNQFDVGSWWLKI